MKDSLNIENQSRSIVHAFVTIANKYPSNIAVAHKFSGQWVEISYAELLEQAQNVAAQLVDRGVEEGDAIVLPARRSPNLCSHLLGILWIGAHYVFIDPEYPAERQEFICSEVGASIGVIDDDIGPIESLQIDWLRIKAGDLSQSRVSATELLPAYVMFTSGSTGTPKGVVAPHLAVYRLVRDTDFIDFAPDQIFLQLSALGFDASTLELWGALLNGGTCVLHPETDNLTPQAINESIQARGVTTLWLTSSLFNIIISEHPDILQSVPQLLIGGEALSVSHVKLGLTRLPNTRIFNGYGPTENTTFTTVYPIPRELPKDIKRIPIGFPIHGTQCDIFDEQLNPTSEGTNTGELIAFGEGLALGYLNRPDLTSERFVEVKCRDGITRRGYRTGDLVLKNPDGSYEYIQRNDKQVKIDGNRIEPGEIELFLNELDNIKAARVVVKIGPANQKRLTAYVVGNELLDRRKVRSQLAEVFPHYMVPHFIVPLESLPINQNGKLDEAKLPDPFEIPQAIRADRNTVADCWEEVLGRKVDKDENFLDAGGTSLEALQLTDQLENVFKISLSATFVFEYSTINSQTRFLQDQLQDNWETDVSGQSAEPAHAEFAIIGMACRFPGAHDVDEFWQNLIDGKETVSFFSAAEISDEVGKEEREHPNYVRAKGILDDCDQFDAAFFGIPPIEASLMDPQQRLMLQLAWHALEDAAIAPGDDQYRTGVFVGMNWARYFQQYVLPNKELLKKFGLFNASLANEADFLSTRISYKLNLKGPSINVFTACSTGLVAIAQACASIEQDQCEVAIAGGISVSTPIRSGYLYQEGGMLSKDGHCRPFDADATGTTFNDGAGVVVVKRLDLAQRDGDRIYATIKGYAINNDGEAKASYTAPSIGGQVAVYKSALERANIPPESVGFIETHGTATPLGDPIEVEALKRVYGSNTDSVNTCALGSVKSNIGHTIHAAGVASFIKAVLSVQNNQIPATLFYNTPNPKLNLDQSHFYVNNTTDTWKTDGLRRAAISSLGVGGTNAHVIIEQYQQPQSNDSNEDSILGHTILMSAKSADTLKAQIDNYQRFFNSDAEIGSVRDASYTSIVGRRHFGHRAAISGVSIKDLANRFSDRTAIASGQANLDKDKKIGFLFTGQGSQCLNMGHWLYQNHAEFKRIYDLGSDIVLSQEGFDIREIVYAESTPPTNDQINQTRIVQPALFLLEYGLAKLLQESGCQPDFLIGHSIGEFPAAVLAGIMSFEDAVKIVARRGSLMQSMPPGKMLVVKNQGKEAIEQYLNGDVCLAASNAPSVIALAGLSDSVMQLKQDLEGQGIQTALLDTSHAFHSHMMEPIVDEFEAHVKSFNLSAPGIPLISTATGRLLKADEAMAPGYWASQLRNPVLFSEALASIGDQFKDLDIGCVELGPGRTLTTLVSLQSDSNTTFAIPALPNSGCDEKTVTDIQQCLGALWVKGFKIDWQQPFVNKNAKKISLPGYAFQPDVHWLPPQVSQDIPTSLPDLQTEEIQPSIQAPAQETPMSADQHLQSIQNELKELIEEITGYDLGDLDENTNFGEVGLDSLLLTQVATAIDHKFDVGITFRHLVEEYTTLAELGAYMAEKIPPKTVPIENKAIDTAIASAEAPAVNIGPTNSGNALQDLVNAQLQIMQMQLQAFSNAGASESLPSVAAAVSADSQKSNVDDAIEETGKPKIKHTPGTRITRVVIGDKLTHAQQEWVDDLLERYQAKFAGSKALTQKHRKHFADPRTVSGFNPEWKEIVFPIVTEKSKGSKLWDIDGNELIDASNGFGPIFFGHSPDFVTSAIKDQLDKGIETGPQSPIAGEVAELFCELTGYERCTFASTGSEAVAGAIRLARTVTGRSMVVMFEGSYHGIFDEVVTRPGRDFQALPAAPGIPREATSNMLILPWGEQESLDAIREYGSDLAAVLVEPVQSRAPQFHDKDYLISIREITRESGTAMILDEVVTGFRVHSGGIGRFYDIDADLGTFGKVVGGGYPIGVIGGTSRFMDALDGGYWQYGDDSIPECGVTFFAGTFVRHPIALVAAKVVMEKIKAGGSKLYQGLAEKTSAMATEAKAFISKMNCEVRFEEFASFFYISVPANAHWGLLLFTMMNLEGIHIQQYRPNFLTTEHTDSDVEKILNAFKKSLANLIQQGLIEGDILAAKKYLQGKPAIPIGAKLGRNAHGEPAYFIEDPDNKGKYLEVGN